MNVSAALSRLAAAGITSDVLATMHVDPTDPQVLRGFVADRLASIAAADLHLRRPDRAGAARRGRRTAPGWGAGRVGDVGGKVARRPGKPVPARMRTGRVKENEMNEDVTRHEIFVEELDDGSFDVSCICGWEATGYEDVEDADVVGDEHVRQPRGVKEKTMGNSIAEQAYLRTMRDIADGHITLSVAFEPYAPGVEPVIRAVYADRLPAAGMPNSSGRWWEPMVQRGWLYVVEGTRGCHYYAPTHAGLDALEGLAQ